MIRENPSRGEVDEGSLDPTGWETLLNEAIDRDPLLPNYQVFDVGHLSSILESLIDYYSQS